jgi:hypothetical protein
LQERAFDELNRLSTKLSSDLLASLNRNDLQGEKIAVLCANNYTYLISILAIWMASGVSLGKTYVLLFRFLFAFYLFYKNYHSATKLGSSYKIKD